MRIHGDFLGGNISVVSQCEDEVHLQNQLRDTSEDWFYWAFCVENAGARTVKFIFDQKKRVGYWGPAVSYDLKSWHWIDHADGESFSYTFTEDESKVYFAHHILYHPDRFYSFCDRIGYAPRRLCVSEKGRSVPYLEFGEGDAHMILTARHHACESTGNYVLEGVLERLKEKPIDGIRVFCVPFVDFDGVVDGDQGKSRIPHDHNRDYTEAPIYKSVEKIREYADSHGCNYGFDFHAPGHKGGRHDKIYIVRNSASKQARFDNFSALLEKHLTEGAMKYTSADDYPPNTGWNVPSSNFGYTMMHRPECEIAFTLENAYFGEEDNKVSAQRLIELGRCFAEAIREYICG